MLLLLVLACFGKKAIARAAMDDSVNGSRPSRGDDEEGEVGVTIIILENMMKCLKVFETKCIDNDSMTVKRSSYG